MSDTREVRNTLDNLYKEYYNTSSKKEKESLSRDIDCLVAQAYEVKPLFLFLNRMRGKSFYSVIMKIVNNEEVSDYEISLALSSMITHALLEMKVSDKSFFDLHINELSRVLSEYLNGQVFDDYIRDYLRKLLF